MLSKRARSLMNVVVSNWRIDLSTDVWDMPAVKECLAAGLVARASRADPEWGVGLVRVAPTALGLVMFAKGHKDAKS